jgi:hypothetical protein
MKPSLILLLFFLATPAFAGDARPFSEWIPKGWKLIAHTSGDLNRDGLEDAVLVAEQTDPANFRQNRESPGASALNLNPRSLIILFGTPGGFRKIFGRDDLLPSEHDEEVPCLADRLGGSGVSIKRRNLVIELHTWLSCGSYGVTHETFTFRPEGARFRLIGYDRSEFSRSSGEQSEFSINYLAGRKKITKELNAFGDSKPKVSWEKLSFQRRFYLDDMSLDCDATGQAQTGNWCR